MHHPTDRITHTTAFVTPVMGHWLEREIAQWVHPMKDQSDDPSHHERMSYHGASSRSLHVCDDQVISQTFLNMSIQCDKHNIYHLLDSLIHIVSDWHDIYHILDALIHIVSDRHDIYHILDALIHIVSDRHDIYHILDALIHSEWQTWYLSHSRCPNTQWVTDMVSIAF